jgi:hypothetical protein
MRHLYSNADFPGWDEEYGENLACPECGQKTVLTEEDIEGLGCPECGKGKLAEDPDRRVQF